MRDTVRQKLQHEIQQIDQLMESFKPLFDVVTAREPDLIDCRDVERIEDLALAGIGSRQGAGRSHGITIACAGRARG